MFWLFPWVHRQSSVKVYFKKGKQSCQCGCCPSVSKEVFTITLKQAWVSEWTFVQRQVWNQSKMKQMLSWTINYCWFDTLCRYLFEGITNDMHPKICDISHTYELGEHVVF